MATELGGASREQHHRAVRKFPYPLDTFVEAGRGEQASSHEDQVGLGHAGVLDRPFKELSVLAEVRIDEHCQELLP